MAETRSQEFNPLRDISPSFSYDEATSSDEGEEDCLTTYSNRRFCSHCNQQVTLKTFRAHKKNYFLKVNLCFRFSVSGQLT